MCVLFNFRYYVVLRTTLFPIEIKQRGGMHSEELKSTRNENYLRAATIHGMMKRMFALFYLYELL